ncbi:MAG: Twitching motility protein PilT [Parcubacteria group bacterium GW2011_GWA2_43_13]|nr:MAG: Twitching motility protein PilT [Parcubacteria group bacterium GW2011_GWA2_43_13]
MTEEVSHLEVSRLLTKAVQMRAAVLHLQPGALPLLRVDGELRSITDEQVVTLELVMGFLDVLASATHKEQLDRDRQIIFSKELENRQRIIVQVEHERGRLVITIRFVDQHIFTFEQLRVPPAVLNVIQQGRGLMIISGPHDSGKSSLIASIVETVNANASKRIVMIESPIERVFINKKSLIEQREVGIDVPSWAAGARSVKETDVDMLVLGGCIDGDQLKEAVMLGEGDLLVIMVIEALSVLHALDILHGYLSPEEQVSWRLALARATSAIVNLRLVPRIGGGRMPIYEVYVRNTLGQAAIGSGHFVQLENVIQSSSQDGMQTLNGALATVVRSGEVTPENALQESTAPDQLKALFR